MSEQIESVLRAHILRALSELAENNLSPCKPVRIELSDGIHELAVALVPIRYCPGLPLVTPEQLLNLTQPPDTGQVPDSQPDAEPDNQDVSATVKERIRTVLPDRDLTYKQLARLAGCAYNSHFRQVVYALIGDGYAVKGDRNTVRATRKLIEERMRQPDSQDG